MLAYLQGFHVSGLVVELEADAPLGVDPYGPLPSPVSRELVQRVGRRLPKLPETLGPIQYRQLRLSPFDDLCRDLLGATPRENPRRVLVAEALYYDRNVTRYVTTIKRYVTKFRRALRDCPASKVERSQIKQLV